jgi:hypothetical protein
LYSYPSPEIKKVDKVKWNKRGRALSSIEMRNSYSVFVQKPNGKCELGRPGRRRENNIKIYIIEKDGVT